MKKIALFTAIALLLGVSFAVAQDEIKLKYFETPDYGYALMLPENFELVEGTKVDAGTTWQHQKGSAALGGFTRGLAGGLQPADSISVNWMWFPDVSPNTLYKANWKSVQDDINSPHPKYTDLKALKIEGGRAFWYKEVDKEDPDDIHRWHIYAVGNKSVYGVILASGAFKNFESMIPIYEEVVKSFKLIPLKVSK